MTTTTAEPRLLLPRIHHFPFDAAAERSAMELRDRNWKVPGIVVSFREYGKGHAKFRVIDKVVGDNFELHFGRPQGHTEISNEWNDTGALNDVSIGPWPDGLVKVPFQLSVYDDESGP